MNTNNLTSIKDIFVFLTLMK